MTDSSATASTPFEEQPTGNAPRYELSDDLSILCLPQEFKDSCRTLAWVNSVCLLTLIIGLVGLKAPKVIIKPLTPVSEPVPVVFTPPEEQPKPQVEEKQDEPPPQETPEAAPQVVTVVAAANAPDVAFSVPVEGAVAVAQTARFATAPPAILRQAPPSRPIQFNPDSPGGDGSFPKPSYPGMAIRNHYQGTATVEFTADAAGNISDVKLLHSSGYTVLDNAAVEVVKSQWRFNRGKPGVYQWPCVFQLQ